MKKYFAIKVKNFIVQLLFTPISFLINALVLTPVYFIVQRMWELDNSINYTISVIVSVMIAFGLNELFLRLKGKRTCEYIELIYEKVEAKIVKETETTIYVEVTPYYERKTEKRTTLEGLLARLLCVVSFPLRLVALLMSYVALFVPSIFVTHRRLNPDMEFNLGNEILHTLFDFVIIPIRGSREGRKSAKGIIWIFVYIVSWAVSQVLAVSLYTVLANNISDGMSAVLVLFGIFCILTSFLLVIKYTVTICFNYSLKGAIVRLIKILAWAIALSALILIATILPF